MKETAFKSPKRLLALLLSVCLLLGMFPMGIFTAVAQEPTPEISEPIYYEIEDLVAEGKISGVTTSAPNPTPYSDDSTSPRKSEVNLTFANAGDYARITLDDIPKTGFYRVSLMYRPHSNNPTVAFGKNTGTENAVRGVDFKLNAAGLNENSFHEYIARPEGYFMLQQGTDTIDIISNNGGGTIPATTFVIQYVGDQDGQVVRTDVQTVASQIQKDEGIVVDPRSDTSSPWDITVVTFISGATLNQTVTVPLEAPSGWYAVNIIHKRREKGARIEVSANGEYVGEFNNVLTNGYCETGLIGVLYVDETGKTDLTFKFAEKTGSSDTFDLALQYIDLIPIKNNQDETEYDPTKGSISKLVNRASLVATTGRQTKTVFNDEGPVQLFDENVNTKLGVNWNRGEYDFVLTFSTYKPVVPRFYTMATANDYPERDPKSWVLYGSVDGENYEVIHQVSDYMFPDERCVYLPEYFTTGCETAYSYFKLVVTEFKSDTASSLYPQFSELRITTGVEEEPAEIEPGLVLHYDFENGATDVAGNYDGAVYHKGVVFENGIAHFFGNGAISVPVEALHSDQLTITMTLYLRNRQTWGAVFEAATKHDNGKAAVMKFMPQTGNEFNDSISMTVRNGVGPEETNQEMRVSDSSTKLPTDEWVQLTYVQDGAVGRVYLNDVMIAERNDLVFRPTQLNPYGYALIGGGKYWPDPLLIGSLADFRIYNVALDDSEIADLTEENLAEVKVEAGEPDEATTEVINLINAIDRQLDAVPGYVINKIKAAREAYDALTVEQKANVTNYNALLLSEAAWKNYAENYNPIIYGWNDTYSKSPWLNRNNTTDEEKQATRDAIADEMRYQYVVNNYLVGNYTSRGMDNYDGLCGIQSEDKPNDNVGNPWGHEGREWAHIKAPFVGMAFTEGGYFAVNPRYSYQIALSNSFKYDGKVWQILWDGTRFHDDVPLDKGNKNVSITSWGYFPGNGGQGDITNNTFRYAYALYNQTHKWENKVLGRPSADARYSDDERVVFQRFEGPNGIAYIAANKEAIQSVNPNSGKPEGAYVIVEDMAQAFIKLGEGAESPAAAAFVITGAPTGNQYEYNGFTVQDFENGKLFTNGSGFSKFYTSDVGDDQIAADIVIAMIAALPDVEEITLDDEDEIAAARDAYENLNNKLLVPSEVVAKLEAAEQKIDDIKYEQANRVIEMINDLPDVEELTLDDKDAVMAAKAEYDKLDADQKARVDQTTGTKLTDAVAKIAQLERQKAIDDVIAAIDNLPEFKNITLADADDIAAVIAAYEALPDNDAKAAVTNILKLWAAQTRIWEITPDPEGFEVVYADDDSVTVVSADHNKFWFIKDQPTFEDEGKTMRPSYCQEEFNEVEYGIFQEPKGDVEYSTLTIEVPAGAAKFITLYGRQFGASTLSTKRDGTPNWGDNGKNRMEVYAGSTLIGSAVHHDGYAKLVECDIPAGTTEIVIRSYIGDNNWFDHMLFGNARFLIPVLPEDPDVEGTIELINAIGSVDYKSGAAIKAARDAYDSLNAQQKAQVTNYDVLVAAEEAFEDIIEAYAATVTITGWPTSGVDNSPWMMNTTEEEKELTRQAVKEEIIYQYRNGNNIGYDPQKPALDDTREHNGGWVLKQLEGKPNDNVGNPWGHEGRQWAFVQAPFVGISFSCSGYLSTKTDRDIGLLGNQFVMDGKVYQQFWNFYKYHDDVEKVPFANIGITTVNLFPGSISQTDVTNNNFRYAFAEYNQSVKEAGKTLGIAAGDVEYAGDGQIAYQMFVGPDGEAYIVGKVANFFDGIGNAFVVNGDILEAVLALAETPAEAFVITGAPIRKAEDGKQYFENGYIENGQFNEYDEPTRIEIEIEQLPKADNIDPYNFEDYMDLVEELMDAYNGLSEEQKQQVANSEKLLAVYNMINDCVAAREVIDMIDDLPPDVTPENVDEVEPYAIAAREAYDNLTASQKALVDNYDYLEYIEEMIEEIRSFVLGDADGDGRVTVSDIIAVRNHIMERIPLEGIRLVAANADQDSDGNITVADIIAIRRIIMNQDVE